MEERAATAPESWRAAARERRTGGASGGELVERLAIIEAQPLELRASGFEQLHDELLDELQRSDAQGSSSQGVA